jgi:ribosomal protein S14
MGNYEKSTRCRRAEGVVKRVFGLTKSALRPQAMEGFKQDLPPDWAEILEKP